MKTYPLRIKEWHGWVNIAIPIPSEIKFFGDRSVLTAFKETKNYTTIIKTEDYEEYIDNISDIFGVSFFSLGDYTVIMIENVHKDTVPPIVDRETWLKGNNIDLSQYLFVYFNQKMEIMKAYRIKDLYALIDIDVSKVTFRDSLTKLDKFSISADCITYLDIDPTCLGDNSPILKTFKGEEADVIWNSMIYKVLGRCMFNPKYVDEEFNFNKWQDKFKDEIKKYGLERIFDKF